MTVFDYSLSQAPTRLGVIVLQSDETIELDLHAMRNTCEVFVSRVPSGTEVTAASLQAMENHITASASLFPTTCTLPVIGYACTSGTAQIGADKIADLVKTGHATPQVTNPLTALIAACRHLNIKRLALLSPYIETISDTLRARLADAGIETPVFGTFAEAEEAKVVRISYDATFKAAKTLAAQGGTDALFLSCTNLRTLPLIDRLEAETGLPVLSSNQVLAWHLGQLAQDVTAFKGPGTLFTSSC